MRGHGSVIVGGTLPVAVHRAVYTELNADVLTRALSLGDCAYLSVDEVKAASDSAIHHVYRAWNAWVHEDEAVC
ncbi:hypothetical protein [Microbacterium album]|uniref:Class II aldolase/adducin N-terminal domain-containing protein n=1 Tax=Microbacterium album TaxID=2053191 RepID=A0A917IJT3_9MICO|nr:hypothetical protein [Microbacterium album]GGH51674.1 hypothetical protein GCM10010921_31200 [Microbacterium album]